MPRRSGTSRQYCECENPATVGKGEAAVCQRCYDLQQWWKVEQLKFTTLREEGQWEWGDYLRIKSEPEPMPPPNTLFTIVGYRPYFLIDKYANKAA